MISREQFEIIAQYMARGAMHDAVKILLVLHDTHPDDPNCLVMLGRCVRMQGDLASAAAYCQKAIAVAPEHFPAYLGLAICLQEEGRHADAQPYFEQASRLAPMEPDPHNSLGLNLVRLGRYPEARAAYQEAAIARTRMAFRAVEMGGITRRPSEYAMEHLMPRPVFLHNFQQMSKAFAIHLGMDRLLIPDMLSWANMARDEGNMAHLYQCEDGTLKIMIPFIGMVAESLWMDRSYATIVNNMGQLAAREGDKLAAGDHFEEAIAFTPTHDDYMEPLAGLAQL
jgi:tetratricopeptide (TPR) repeat protein